MTYPVYSIRDLKTQFGLPFVEANDPAAIRNFIAALRMDSGVMSYAPKDFDLYNVGTFDTDTGILHGEFPVLVYSGASFEV